MRGPLRCALIALVLASSGCSLFGVGGYVAGRAGADRADYQFWRWLQTTNAERKKIGLDTLDMCSEMYRYNRDWANVQPDCKDRIKHYEHGDSTALWWPR